MSPKITPGSLDGNNSLNSRMNQNTSKSRFKFRITNTVRIFKAGHRRKRSCAEVYPESSAGEITLSNTHQGTATTGLGRKQPPEVKQF